MRNARMWLVIGIVMILTGVWLQLRGHVAAQNVTDQFPVITTSQNPSYGDTGINYGPENCLSKSGAIVPCKPPVPFDVPPKRVSKIPVAPNEVDQSYPLIAPARLTNGTWTCFQDAHLWTGHSDGLIPECIQNKEFSEMKWSCEDKKRVPLTDEAGERHCFAFWLLGASNPR